MTEPEQISTTQAVYDATAEAYAATIGTEITAAIEGPIDRALLRAFVELVGSSVGTVADIGCGPGRVAALLAGRGLDVVGVDISPAMLDIARRTHPGIRFEEGQLAALPLADASLAGAVCWYSIIHTPPEHLGAACTELRRVLAPGGHLLVAFQAGGGEGVHREDAHGSGLPLTNHRHSPDTVADQMNAAGLHVHTTTIRESELDHESTAQAFLLARTEA